jgi:hypothetical protein
LIENKKKAQGRVPCAFLLQPVIPVQEELQKKTDGIFTGVEAGTIYTATMTKIIRLK